MTKVFFPATPERAEAMNKNLDERGQEDAQIHAEKIKNHTPFKAYKKKREIAKEEIDAEVKAKASGPRGSNRDKVGHIKRGRK